MRQPREPKSNNPSDYGFVTWNDGNSFKSAMTEYGSAVASFDQNFVHIDRNVSVRTGFNQTDYDYFRPTESVAENPIDIIKQCDFAYSDEGLISNVVDLMADFTCQGIKIVHPNPGIQKFHRQWFKQVKGKERSERFANYLFRIGTVVSYRTTAKLKQKDVERLQSTIAKADINIEAPIDIEKNELPWKYTFYTPMHVKPIGEELAAFTNKYTYTMELSQSLINKIRNPKPNEVSLLNSIPDNIINEIRGGSRSFTFDPNKTTTYFYKKDDWKMWGKPILQPILKDIVNLRKMKLADRAALDGAISQVRLWRLGNMENKIFPKKAAIAALAAMITNHLGGGSMDLIWGPDLDFKESASNAFKFLGEAKYIPVYNAIYAGLGIPPTLTGSATSSGFTNNYISLKTLIERLNYGRDQLKAFWENELALVQKAMGFRFPATIQFDRMTLSDEAQEKALLVQLADRGMISLETILDRFDEDFELERHRMNRESKDREKGRLPRKGGPWNDPEFKESIMKMAIQRGIITPSETGTELEPRKPGEKSPQEMMMDMEKNRMKQQKQSGIPGQGRPISKKDSTKRKTKNVKPRTSAGFMPLFMWGQSALKEISDILNPLLLKLYQKKNMRSLSHTEAAQAEDIRFCVLSNMKPYQQIDVDSIYEIVNGGLKMPNNLFMEAYRSMSSEFMEKFGREPVMDELRYMQVATYAFLNEQGE